MFVDAFARGIQVIRTFGPDSERQTLSDVAARAGISRASARRLLHTLLQLDYVRFDGRYFSLKPKILDLGYAYISSMEFGNLVIDSLHQLATRTNSTCAITVLDGHDVVYVARVSMQRLTNSVFSVGSRFPAYALSMGRVQIAELSDEDLDGYLASAKIERFTPYTVVDRDALRRIIRADGKKGWSIVKRELDEGLCAIGMPLRNKSGRVIAAVGLGIRPDRSDDPDAIEELRAELASTATTINELLRLRA